MFIKEGIAYAAEPEQDMLVKRVRVTNPFCLLVEFTTGEYRVVDVLPLLEKEAFKPLAHKKVFEDFKLERGILTWLDGAIDIAPEALYALGFEYEIPA